MGQIGECLSPIVGDYHGLHQRFDRRSRADTFGVVADQLQLTTEDLGRPSHLVPMSVRSSTSQAAECYNIRMLSSEGQYSRVAASHSQLHLPITDWKVVEPLRPYRSFR